jgi:2-methylaconitate cis-trans-isomerase PrpF
MQKRIPAVIMRGGTSKGVFFHANHLPADAGIRDQAILAAFGSPDPNRRQIDGLGGGVSTTSKTAIISRSTDPAYDVVYNFGQVSIDRPIVDYKGNCGNISSAVGPFAVDEGLVPAVSPVTTVRIHQKNTDKLIIAEVPVKDGRYNEEGDYAISGVPGTGGKITLRFADPGWAVTGRLLPTGHPIDTLDVSGAGSVEVTIIDAANPVVLVAADQLGLSGTEIEQIDSSQEIKDKLEAIRCAAAVVIGLAKTPEEATRSSQAVPKIACVSVPQAYTALGGRQVQAEAIDLTVRIMSMGTLHRSIAISGAIATAGASMIEGTVACNLKSKTGVGKTIINLGHPGGIVDVGAKIEMRAGEPHYVEAEVGRTARRLMEGYVLVPEKYTR